MASGLSEKGRSQRQKSNKTVTTERTDERFENSLSRSRTRVHELALCNPWEYFATFTLAETKQDRFDLKCYIKDFGNWIGNYKRKYAASDFAYLIIPEQHKDGAWHAHGLLHGVAPDSLSRNEHGYLDLAYYQNRFGYISLSPIKDKNKCASYVTKYITKDTASTARNIGKGYHTFYASRGLQGRVVLGQGYLTDYQTDYQNDFCGVSWIDENQVNELLNIFESYYENALSE